MSKKKKAGSIVQKIPGKANFFGLLPETASFVKPKQRLANQEVLSFPLLALMAKMYIVNPAISIVQAIPTMTWTICFFCCFFLNNQKNLVSYKNKKKRMTVPTGCIFKYEETQDPVTLSFSCTLTALTLFCIGHLRDWCSQLSLHNNPKSNFTIQQHSATEKMQTLHIINTTIHPTCSKVKGVRLLFAEGYLFHAS